MRTRRKPIQIYLNESELKKLDELCKKSGLSYSGLIRNLITDKTIKERPDVDFLELRQAVDHIGININQIAHWANANGGITPEQFEEAKKLLSDVKWVMRGWSKKWL